MSQKAGFYDPQRHTASELNLSFSFKIEGFNYMVFALSESKKCFGCGGEGHLIRSCPERLRNTQPAVDAVGERVPLMPWAAPLRLKNCFLCAVIGVRKITL